MSLVHLFNNCGLSALLIVEVSFEVIFVNVPKFQAFIVRFVLLFQVFLVLSLLFAQFFVVGCRLHLSPTLMFFVKVLKEILFCF